jgi:hypothetical protein
MTNRKNLEAHWIVVPLAVLAVTAACNTTSTLNSGGAGGNGTGQGGATNGTATNATNGVTSTDGSTTNGTTNGATTNGATTNGATTNGATTGNSTTAATTGNTTAATTATSSSTGGGCVEPAGMVGMTAAHNQARANAMPVPNPALPPMTWNCQIAAVAQAYSANCVWAHSMNPNYGENLYASSGLNSTPANVVADWVSEDAYYNYANNTCQAGKECGHYTQVVWRKSVQVGCGHTHCTTGSPFGSGSWDNWVCNYAPPGNYVGQKPY